MRIGEAAARIVGVGAAGLLTATTLAGCGSGSSSAVAQDPGASASTPSTTTSSATTDPSGPTCSHVWRKGAKLPRSYRGCVGDAGWVKAQVYECSDGHRLVTFAHEFYAVPGRTISRAATTLAQDQEFRHTMAVCGA